MMTNPKLAAHRTQTIAVLLSIYNGSEFLEELLNSVLNQIHVEVKVFARDDNSSDDSAKILHRFKDRITILPNLPRNVGSTVSYLDILNIALRDECDFKFFAFCDQDDYWLPSKLSSTINVISIEKFPALTYSAQEYFQNKKGRYPSENRDISPITDNPFFQNPIRGCTMVFNRPLAGKIAELDPVHLIKHDFAAYICARLYGKIFFVSEIGMYYRIHENNEIGIKKKNRNRLSDITNHANSKLVGQAREIMSHNDSKADIYIARGGDGLLKVKKNGIFPRLRYILAFKRLRINGTENFIVKMLYLLRMFPY